MLLSKKKMIRGAGGAVLAASLAVGGVALAASAGTADPVPVMSATDVASNSALVKQANEVAGLGLDSSKARRVGTSGAPSELESAEIILIPSETGPCLLRNDQRQGAGPDDASKTLVARGSLSCGAGIAPTVAITADGTIGAVSNPTDSVDIVGSDGSTTAAKVDANGVWFAPAGAVKALIDWGGSVHAVDLMFGQ